MEIAPYLARPAGANGGFVRSRFAGAASTPAALSLRRTVQTPASLLHPPPASRSAAARRSFTVVHAARRSFTVVRAARRDSSDGAVILGRDEACRVARVVALFLFIQKASFAREKKVWEDRKKLLFMGLLAACLFTGFMAYKGQRWATMLVTTFEKGEKLYKIVAAVATILK